MWYNTIPTVGVGSWLAQVVALFDDILDALLGVPFFAFLASLAAVFCVFGFWAWIIRRGRRGRL